MGAMREWDERKLDTKQELASGWLRHDGLQTHLEEAETGARGLLLALVVQEPSRFLRIPQGWAFL